MKTIKKISIFAFAKFLTILGALVGLACGAFYSFGGLLIDTLVTLGWITTTDTPGLSYGTILAFGALIGMPVLFSAGGFLLGIIGGILYNFFCKIAS